MSIITGTVIEVGSYRNRHGGRIETAFGRVDVGRSEECARSLAGYLYLGAVSVDVDDITGRIRSVRRAPTTGEARATTGVTP